MPIHKFLNAPTVQIVFLRTFFGNSGWQSSGTSPWDLEGPMHSVEYANKGGLSDARAWAE